VGSEARKGPVSGTAVPPPNLKLLTSRTLSRLDNLPSATTCGLDRAKIVFLSPRFPSPGYFLALLRNALVTPWADAPCSRSTNSAIDR